MCEVGEIAFMSHGVKVWRVCSRVEVLGEGFGEMRGVLVGGV